MDVMIAIIFVLGVAVLALLSEFGADSRDFENHDLTRSRR
jgi:hypothetical protein